VARALAVVGMVMVHIGPVRMEGSGLVGAAYRLPHGRASILFVVVAGIGVSLLAGDRGRERLRGTTARLLWSALVLLPVGLALQTLPVNVAVILHFYAFYFLLAIVALRLPDRVLVVLCGVSALLGPVAVLAARRQRPEWFAPGFPEWTDAGHVARDLVISGTYPAVVWAVPLLAGMWVGRQDLRSSSVAWRLAAAGAVLAAASFAAHDRLSAWLGTPVSEADWRQLVALAPHNEMPLWVLSSTGIAVAVVGCCMLLARALPRLVWPAVALGQLALTVYVAQVLVLAARPAWLERDTFSSAWWSVGRFALVALVLVSAWRAFASRGPLEALLHIPWWLARKRGSPEVRHIG
jgi:Heparan-alpha-glucosaminide N-acetyltransferase, catalytic